MASIQPRRLGVSGGAVFVRADALGEFALRPLSPAADAPLLHGWTSQPHARFWGMNALSVEQVREFYEELNRTPGAAGYLGTYGGTPCFLLERYNPAADPVGDCYAVRPGDVGMHLLIAPAERPITGFSLAVMRTVMAYLFSLPGVRRVVVEPDVRNHKIHALNRRVGFVHQRQIWIGSKQAYLAFCTRSQYEAAQRHAPRPPVTGVQPVQAARWAQVNRQLLQKALAEFAHERILRPVPVAAGPDRPQAGEWTEYTLATPDGGASYRFRARLLPLAHWDIEPASIEKRVDGVPQPLDAAGFIVEFAEVLGLAPANLPVYVEEIAATLATRARKYASGEHDAAALAGADFQTVESSMTEGHPAFIANSGRIGFDAHDLQRYAPESGAPVRLVWLAAHRSRAHFTCAADLAYEQLLAEELDVTTRARFTQALAEQGLAPADYLWLPVHPWQWTHKLAHTYAGELASRELVYLGEGDDAYLAQQSIRTFFNASNPGRRYVKTALSVLNMGFTRGLSAYYMRTNPAINDWVAGLVQGDATLQRHGFTVLREVAGVGYVHPLYGAGPLAGNHLNKMLAALWRESPLPLLAEGQRLMTMAALLHVDAEGDALVAALIRRSGLEVEAWLRRYLDAYLVPLLHCYYRYGLVFMPHGENLILVLEDDVPVRAIMKDIGEEVGVLNGRTPVPEAIARINVTMPADKETLSILTDVFDCFLRYLSAILLRHMGYAPTRFWAVVAACAADYEAAHPALAERFASHDLFAERFALSCLNRLQLKNNQQLINLADPFEALAFAGELDNPIARHSPRRSRT